MFIGEDEFGLPIGQVRFDVEGGEAFVDISVDPCMKRRGIGARLLNQGLERLLEMCLITKVVALVRRENLASTKLFLSVGFRLAECQDEASHHKFWMSPNFNG
jgi:ribosomal protein S18 acetylase RimI-like enzyme